MRSLLFVTLIITTDDKIQDNGMGRACNTHMESERCWPYLSENVKWRPHVGDQGIIMTRSRVQWLHVGNKLFYCSFLCYDTVYCLSFNCTLKMEATGSFEAFVIT
jgi:hypothetical protein